MLSRRKGKVFERAVVGVLRAVFPTARRRAMQARGGREGADVERTPGFWFECGHGRQMSPVAKWRQAATDEAADRATENIVEVLRAVPVAVTKRDRGEVLATLLLSDLVELIHRSQRAYELEPLYAAATDPGTAWKNSGVVQEAVDRIEALAADRRLLKESAE